MSDPAVASIQASLLQRCAAGDSGALRELYDSCSPQLFAVLLRMLSRADLAEDALQEAFIQIWHNAGSYSPGKGQPMTWMCGIARYRALDSLRRVRADRYVDDADETIATLAAPEPDPSELMSATVDGRILRECLERLTDGQKKSIQLAYFKGYSHDEVSASLGAPLGTVKSWVRRGLQALKACVDR